MLFSRITRHVVKYIKVKKLEVLLRTVPFTRVIVKIDIANFFYCFQLSILTKIIIYCKFDKNKSTLI